MVQLLCSVGPRSLSLSRQRPRTVLQVFLLRVRKGDLAKHRDAVHARTAEDYLRHVGQTFQRVGAPDPRKKGDSIDFCLTCMIAAFKKADPPPHRVKPIPIKVIRSIAGIARLSSCTFSIAVADMIMIAFFYLLRPGEYTASPSDTQPFNFRSVQLFVGHRSLISSLILRPNCLNLNLPCSPLINRKMASVVKSLVLGAHLTHTYALLKH